MLSHVYTLVELEEMPDDRLLVEMINCKDPYYKKCIQQIFEKRIRKNEIQLLNEHQKKLLLTDILRDVALFDYLSYLERFKKEIPEDLDSESIHNNIKMYSEDDIVVARSFNRTLKGRKNRLYNYITDLFKRGPCLFGTLTFREDVLDNTNEKTRRAYVTRFLKKHYPDGYVANIDYGDQEEREHYHFIANGNKYDLNAWEYGYSFYRKCGTKKKDRERLAYYTAKLTNHALKKGTKRKRLIYSR